MKKDAADKLAKAVWEYLRESDNPMPDLLLRRQRREQMREALAAYEAQNTEQRP